VLGKIISGQGGLRLVRGSQECIVADTHTPSKYGNPLLLLGGVTLRHPDSHPRFVAAVTRSLARYRHSQIVPQSDHAWTRHDAALPRQSATMRDSQVTRTEYEYKWPLQWVMQGGV